MLTNAPMTDTDGVAFLLSMGLATGNTRYLQLVFYYTNAGAASIHMRAYTYQGWQAWKGISLS
jgi:hypothetical protein